MEQCIHSLLVETQVEYSEITQRKAVLADWCLGATGNTWSAPAEVPLHWAEWLELIPLSPLEMGDAW